ncbi:S-adenosylmethionine-dependent methyltransferase protein [Pseudomonas sp. StFLB209]|uniref:methyltransferase n=1 Tax=Pseudomonas sp. StFLB209 TaxID=1028989 RepID=UPI0004F7DD8F|nr:methyltransferase [Pseudomonas sp. StFLB209]BAP42060.1 S-adenosylmethionine-dependent methyltransferase protein [Pseudomonas sp. StFLB209]
MSTSDLLSRFQALDRFLIAHQALWRPKPFTELCLPWEATYPQLSQWLRSRTLEQAEAAHNHPEHLQAPPPFSQLAAQSVALARADELPSQPLNPVEPRLSVDVPGRKWQQIEAFASHLNLPTTPTRWLDWCAGKGHLGRRLTGPDQRLTCLEYDPALVEAGRELSLRHRVNAQHVQQDVMAAETASHLHADHTAVALHACGDLHVQLMRLASATGCPQLAIAPCCYNRTAHAQYQALSQAGQISALQLSRDDLGLPLSETVTAPARVRRQRDLSMARRLGFDLLQRRLRCVDNYLPTPSLPVAWLAKPYADYCHELAARKQLPIPGPQDWAALEAQGWQRLAEVRNLELLRNLFRRPLEMWLVLDRALYLQEQGYNVQLGTFCAPELTPRNLLLIARQMTAQPVDNSVD